MIRPYCVSLTTPPRISLLGPYNKIGGLFVVSAPSYGSLPADVLPTLIQTTMTELLPSPRLKPMSREPMQMRTCH